MTRDQRRRLPVNEGECAEIVVRVLQDMGLTAPQIWRTLLIACRSRRSIYRDCERIRDQPRAFRVVRVAEDDD